MNFKYSKKDKLKSKKQINLIFEQGASVMAYPLLIKYHELTFKDKVLLKAGVSVSKRNFKKAVDRTKIKRLLRESYRLNKPYYFDSLTQSYGIMIMYIGTEKPQFYSLNKTLKSLLNKLDKKISPKKHDL
jgi:ribonuclease P protein component